MPARDVVGTTPTRFTAYGDGERPVLLDDGRFSFLFVMQGEVVCAFSNGCSIVALAASQMMVVDKQQLRELRCVGDTVILEYVQYEKMSSLMQTVFRAFSTPCSEIITLNSKLQTWCKTVLSLIQNNLFAEMATTTTNATPSPRCY